MLMEQEKQCYICPEVAILEVRTGGIICGSLTDPDDYDNGGDPLKF